MRGSLDILKGDVEARWWYDRRTEAHYDRAAEYLRSLNAVWRVMADTYPGGKMWVHTPYSDAAVVGDVCNHFGFRIHWFSVVAPSECGFDCVTDHDPCVEINLNYPSLGLRPLPLESDSSVPEYSDIGRLTESDRLFDYDD